MKLLQSGVSLQAKNDFVETQRSFFRACFWNKDSRARQYQDNFESISQTSKTCDFPLRILKDFWRTTFFACFHDGNFFDKKNLSMRDFRKKNEKNRERNSYFVHWCKKKSFISNKHCFLWSMIKHHFQRFSWEQFLWFLSLERAQNCPKKNIFLWEKTSGPQECFEIFFFSWDTCKYFKKSFFSYTRHKIIEKLKIFPLFLLRKSLLKIFFQLTYPFYVI